FMGASLALDADEQRFAIVDALAQLIGAGLEQPACGAFEEEERWPRFELRILLHELAVPLLERREMLVFFRREPLEHFATAWIDGQRRRPSVELEAAALGGNRHPQRITGEHELGCAAVHRRRLRARPALFADTVDLNDRVFG